MEKSIKFLSAITLSLLFISCVPQRKYNDTVLLKDHYKSELDSLKKDTPTEYDNNVYGQYDLKRAEAQLKQTNESLASLQEDYDHLKSYNDDILVRYDELLMQNRELLSSSSSDAQQLSGQLFDKQRTIDEQERVIQRLQNQIRQLDNNTNSSTDPVEYNKPVVREIITNDCQELERQVAELNTLLRQKDSRLINLRTGLNKALLGFSSSDLKVSESQGKIYVSLSQNLLYAPGSDRIDWKGKQALKTLADVLNQNPEINVNVEGHTDTDGSPQNNWDLSVNRATSVVTVLTDYNVNPKRITASGKGAYFPVAPNTTAAGKAQNRRTEIILSPKLDELYQIINN